MIVAYSLLSYFCFMSSLLSGVHHLDCPQCTTLLFFIFKMSIGELLYMKQSDFRVRGVCTGEVFLFDVN